MGKEKHTNPWRTLRVTLALLFFIPTTLLFLDFTGTIHAWAGWMAHVQLLPALLAVNVGIVAALVVLTLIFGRLYCSTICPLGVFQDGVAHVAGLRRKNRYAWTPAKRWLRYGVLAVFTALLLAGVTSLTSLIAPYSAYGRMVSALVQPLWMWANNALAWAAERIDSYAFYSVDVWMKSAVTLAVAAVTAVVISVLAWRGGRTWCNTICPVGTVLGFVSKYSWLRPVIDTSKCNGCGLCARNCKASCIDSATHTIDYSRCVACMECLSKCSRGAISYVHPKAQAKPEPADTSRRNFLAGIGLLAAATAVKAQEKRVDGGLAAILDKKVPERKTPVVPPGAHSLQHLSQHCTRCQLCVSVCPNGVLRPSSDLERLMLPESSYERGYCRPECTRCADVCPAHAIRPITAAEKSATQIGHAVWVRENCIPLTVGDRCGHCADHCPTGAITMILSDPKNEKSPKIPAVNTERCIGCGACENHCPARPFSAIYVEGHEMHRMI